MTARLGSTSRALLWLPTVSVGYSLLALLLPGDSTNTLSFRLLRSIVGGERGMQVSAAVLLAVHVLALVSRRARAGALGIAVFLWGLFAATVAASVPGALLPGLTIGVVGMTVIAFHEAVASSPPRDPRSRRVRQRLAGRRRDH